MAISKTGFRRLIQAERGIGFFFSDGVFRDTGVAKLMRDGLIERRGLSPEARSGFMTVPLTAAGRHALRAEGWRTSRHGTRNRRLGLKDASSLLPKGSLVFIG